MSFAIDAIRRDDGHRDITCPPNLCGVAARAGKS
ncbi:uncharacterized protein CMC5_059570 [Chondromyces crocatus]|uniref:Uncharacterized protein n=1 Tax=Chondromyces crocatus TaxID=52 RepID=A0A0K1ELQ2_CHOCO|nr:uncharacterized protein CMC5_059570 [Chondromyces crocatus]